MRSTITAPNSLPKPSLPTTALIEELKKATLRYIAAETKNDTIVNLTYDLKLFEQCNIPIHRKANIRAVDQFFKQCNTNKSLADHVFVYLSNIQTGWGCFTKYFATGKSKYKDELISVLNDFCPELFALNHSKLTTESSESVSQVSSSSHTSSDQQELIDELVQEVAALKKHLADSKLENDWLVEQLRLQNTLKDYKSIKKQPAANSAENDKVESVVMNTKNESPDISLSRLSS